MTGADQAGAYSAAVLAELEQLREACSTPAGGGAVLAAFRLVALTLPAELHWLRDGYLRRYARVTGAYVPSWDDDEAFGRPWPKGIGAKRLAGERRRMALRSRVHAAVWAAVSADLSRSVGRILFDEISEQLDIPVSASVAESAYYQALARGELNVATWRDAERRGARVIPAISRNSQDDSESDPPQTSHQGCSSASR